MRTKSPQPPLLVVVSGAPGTGKTTISERVTSALQIPLINKDFIKESLFESLGWSDRQWSRKLGLASLELLIAIVGRHLKVGSSIVAENNFRSDYDPPRFSSLLREHTFSVIEIHCRTDREVLLSRYRRRARSGGRHPGHVDGGLTDELERALDQGVHAPLNLGGVTLIVDTTELDSIDYHGIVESVRSAMSRR